MTDNKPSTAIKYAMIQDVIKDLRVKDIRHLFMLMRKTPQVGANHFFPKYGLTCGEFTTGYVLNMPHRSAGRSTCCFSGDNDGTGGGSAAAGDATQEEVSTQGRTPQRKDATGVVLTTHGDKGSYAKAAMYSLCEHISTLRYAVMYINGPSDDLVHQELEDVLSKQPHIEVVRIKDAAGGLTATWNDGIRRCLKKGCDVILVRNNNIYVDCPGDLSV